MRKNPDQRTVDLRAKYRAKHGDDWWQDEDIKAEYRAERREIYRSGPPSDPTGRRKQTSTKTSSKKSQKPKRKVTRRDPIKAMAVVLGTKTSKEASTIIVDEVGVAVPEGVSITRKDLKSRSNFTVQTDDGQKMVVSVTPSGRTTIKQYTSDGDKHFEQSYTLDEWLEGQDVINIYLGDIMVEYGEEEEVIRPPKDKQAQKNAKQMGKLVEFLEKELKEPFRFAVTKSSDGSVEEIYVAPVFDGNADEDISLGISDDGLRIFMSNHPEENIQGYYSTLKGMKRDIRKFIRQAKELLGDEDVNLTESKFQKKLSHFGRHPTGSTKKQLSATKAKKIAKQALEELGIEIGRWTSMYGGQGFGAKVKNRTLDGEKVRVVISMHADYWDVAFTEDRSNPKELLSEVGGVYHFYAQKEFGDLVKLMANYYLEMD